MGALVESRRQVTVFVLALALLAFAPVATMASETYSFSYVGTGSGSGTAGQYSVTVYGSADSPNPYNITVGSTQALFVFKNTAVVNSSITDVYFQDGTLLGIAKISDSTGVSYTAPASPANLPGGNGLTPKFITTQQFSADSDPPVLPNGVNKSTEWLGVLFNLKSPNDNYNAVIAALNQTDLYIGSDNHLHGAGGAPALRVGIHVQGIGTKSLSESFVSVANPVVVPEPSTMALALCGILGVGLVQLRSWRRKDAVTL